ncbi:MAG: FapA family protein [Clostridiales Family XIII bacterium]|jgi:uncharacterized protein (DUF342 family)|nr:FapA family protein [Clostridiales Family XIII bacterium]
MAGFKVWLKISDDYLKAYLVYERGDEGGAEAPSLEELEKMLAQAKVSQGVDKAALASLAGSPPEEGGEFPVAAGAPAENGANGSVEFFVKNSDEYKPDYGGDGDGLVDYKNVDVFQLVKAGQPLCEIKPPTQGKPGFNILGAEIPARAGAEAPSPMGQNTEMAGDGVTLVAAKAGSVSFRGGVVSVQDVLNVPGDVSMASGNIRFDGDVMVQGSVNEGFVVECGGTLKVKGKIGNAEVRVKGDLIVGEGLSAARRSRVTVGGFVKCRYIESSALSAKEGVFTDYIIDSDVECGGNVVLSGKRALLVGGRTAVMGELSANYIGNEREIRTRIELMENHENKEMLARLLKERDAARAALKSHRENISKLRCLTEASSNPEAERLLKQLTCQLPEMSEAYLSLDARVRALKEAGEDYPGSVVCRRVMYPGAEVLAGGSALPRDHTSLEHCRIYLNNGNWVKGLA